MYTYRRGPLCVSHICIYRWGGGEYKSCKLLYKREYIIKCEKRGRREEEQHMHQCYLPPPSLVCVCIWKPRGSYMRILYYYVLCIYTGREWPFPPMKFRALRLDGLYHASNLLYSLTLPCSWSRKTVSNMCACWWNMKVCASNPWLFFFF